MHKILVSAPYLQNEFAEYAERFAREGWVPVLPPVTERLSEDALVDLIGDVDGMICGDDPLTARVLDRALRLQVIVKWGTGVDSIDQAHAAFLGIPVRNTPNAFTAPVSDSVLAYILAFARNVVGSDRVMKDGRWEKLPAVSMAERTVGIIGVGNIGRAVAGKLAAFGGRVLGTDILRIPDDVCAACRIEMVSLEQLLRESDFVSVNCTLNPTSRHLLKKHRFSMMKPTAVVINTARGPIIRQDDLVWALEHGVVAGAALDVFEDEPLPAASPLRRMPNVLLSSHATNASPRSWKAVHENSIEMLRRGLNGKGRGSEAA
jgi:D-3-phosphoglycerate dehydrogenase / 2-oxoglutarate reductase